MRIRWYGQSAFSARRRAERLHRSVRRRHRRPRRARAALRLPADRRRPTPTSCSSRTSTRITTASMRSTAIATVLRSTAGTLQSPLGEVVAVASEHDDVAGTQRGPNTIFRFALDGLRVCHFGDFGQSALRPEQQAAIGEVDILFLPVGDGPTVGGERAAAVVRALRPRLVVPMHYRTEAVNFLDPPDAFLAALARAGRAPRRERVRQRRPARRARRPGRRPARRARRTVGSRAATIGGRWKTSPESCSPAGALGAWAATRRVSPGMARPSPAAPPGCSRAAASHRW